MTDPVLEQMRRDYDARNRALRDAHFWQRIATHLYKALTDPDSDQHDRELAISMYRNYAYPEDSK